MFYHPAECPRWSIAPFFIKTKPDKPLTIQILFFLPQAPQRPYNAENPRKNWIDITTRLSGGDNSNLRD